MIDGTSTATQNIVQKLWGLCNVLRDDGITYQDYVTELTFLLFLKMMQETKREDSLPQSYRWGDLTKREGEDLLTHYRALLLKLGTEGKGMVRDIFTDAQTSLRKPANLKTLVTEIDKLDWFSARREGLGDLYEGLLQKNAGEKKSGAGQYFTPRPLIDCVVRLPQTAARRGRTRPGGRDRWLPCGVTPLYQGWHRRALQPLACTARFSAHAGIC